MKRNAKNWPTTGHKIDDETFITHVLISLIQSEYGGAILVIKENLRRWDVELPEIEQILEDRYQAMKHLKGWKKEEDDYALFTSQSIKKKPKKAFNGHYGYCGVFGHKAADCHNKKCNQNNCQKGKNEHKKKYSTKGDSKGNGHKDMSKIKCLNFVNLDTLHEIAQKHVIMLIMLKKVSNTRKSRIRWIWTILV